MKDEDYFVYNQKKGLEEIAKQLKFINWNLGKLTAHLLGDKELIKKIVDDEKKENEESNL